MKSVAERISVPSSKAAVVSKRTRKGKSARKAVPRVLRTASGYPVPKGSMLELCWDLAGSLSGPSDLSTNPKYMEGFGE